MKHFRLFDGDQLVGTTFGSGLEEVFEKTGYWPEPCTGCSECSVRVDSSVRDDEPRTPSHELHGAIPASSYLEFAEILACHHSPKPYKRGLLRYM